MTDMELNARLMIAWSMRESENPEVIPSKDYNEQSFIARIIRKKLEAFEIDINVPDELIMLIEIATNSNPGVSQVMLHEVMSKIPNLQEGYTIKAEDFAMAYPSHFPSMNNPEDEEYFRKAWDAQKDESGCNRCDTLGWWMECFNKK